jgi:hypothetical protein
MGPNNVGALEIVLISDVRKMKFYGITQSYFQRGVEDTPHGRNRTTHYNKFLQVLSYSKSTGVQGLFI